MTGYYHYNVGGANQTVDTHSMSCTNGWTCGNLVAPPAEVPYQDPISPRCSRHVGALRNALLFTLKLYIY